MRALVFKTAVELAALIRRREVSAAEVLEAHLGHIYAHNPQLNAIVTLDEAGARSQAAAADAALAQGQWWGPLHGVPMTVKDVFETAGMRTTCGTKKLADYVPTRDAVVVARLRAAGAVLLGKTNMAELGRDFQCQNPLFGRTNNPWDLARTPGGSSGGSAAAVAAGLIPLDVGSDVGGSVRIPAHHCGVYGLKPTEGLVSFQGTLPPLPGEPAGPLHMRSFGPLARSVADLRLGLSVIAESKRGLRPGSASPLAWTKLRVAWTDTFAGVPIPAETRRALHALVAELEARGCHVEECHPAHFDFSAAWRTYGEILGCEGRQTVPWLVRRPAAWIGPFLFRGQPTTQGVLRGLCFDATQYETAVARRRELTHVMDQFLSRWDLWLCPVAACLAFPHRRPGPRSLPLPLPAGDETVPYWMAGMAYTTIFNLTGHPAVVLPVASSATGVPVGLQLVGQRWQDGRLLALAEKLDTMTSGFQHPPHYHSHARSKAMDT